MDSLDQTAIKHQLATNRLMARALAELSDWRLAQMESSFQQAHREAVARVDRQYRELNSLLTKINSGGRQNEQP